MEVWHGLYGEGNDVQGEADGSGRICEVTGLRTSGGQVEKGN